MNLPPNRFLAAIRAGQPQIGIWVSLSNAFAAEAVAGAGFDWALIDTEHSPIELPDVIDHVRAIEGTGLPAIVRPPSTSRWPIARVSGCCSGAASFRRCPC